MSIGSENKFPTLKNVHFEKGGPSKVFPPIPMVTQPGAPTWTGPTLELLFQRAQTATRQGVPLSTRRSCLSRQKCTHHKLIVQEVDGTSRLPQITKTGQITLITVSPPLQYGELKLDKLRKLGPNCQSHVFNTCSMGFAKS